MCGPPDTHLHVPLEIPPVCAFTTRFAEQDASTGNHKGFCFLEYESAEIADTVIDQMNGFVLAG
eukprot:8773062-Pyramimonas_sp.AAC.1